MLTLLTGSLVVLACLVMPVRTEQQDHTAG